MVTTQRRFVYSCGCMHTSSVRQGGASRSSRRCRRARIRTRHSASPYSVSLGVQMTSNISRSSPQICASCVFLWPPRTRPSTNNLAIRIHRQGVGRSSLRTSSRCSRPPSDMLHRCVRLMERRRGACFSPPPASPTSCPAPRFICSRGRAPSRGSVPQPQGPLP
jgi:hypothetical protein